MVHKNVVSFPFPVAAFSATGSAQQAMSLVDTWITLLRDLQYPRYILPGIKNFDISNLIPPPHTSERVYSVPLDEIRSTEPHFQMELILALRSHREGYWLLNLLHHLSTYPLPWKAEVVEEVLAHAARVLPYYCDSDLSITEQFMKTGGVLSPAMRTSLQKIRVAYPQPITRALDVKSRRHFMRLIHLVEEDVVALPSPDESWAALALSDLAALPNEKQLAWQRLFGYVEYCEAARPPAVWINKGQVFVEAIGTEDFYTHVVRWFHAVTLPLPSPERYYSLMPERNINMLKGMTWLCAASTQPETARALASLTHNCLKKQAGDGPWAARAANGAIWALSEMECSEATGHLSRLKLKVTSRGDHSDRKGVGSGSEARRTDQSRSRRYQRA